MKNSQIKSIALAFFVLPLITMAQTVVVDSLFWAMAANESAYKSSGEGFTNNVNLNALFEQYNVTSYEQALPFANTEQLQHVYEIGCDCDIDSLMDDIREQFPELYSGMKRLDYENIELYDPADHMWSVTTDTEYLWHLKKIQADLAWNITLGNPNIKTAIIDVYFDMTHPDLGSKFVYNYDPYDNITYNCTTAANGYVVNGSPRAGHGTGVASYVAGETTPTNGTSNGQLASVGFNTKMIGYKAWNGNYLQRAHHASVVMGAKVLTSSAGGWYSCPAQDGGMDSLTVKEILDNGTTIIMPAGNGSGTHNFCASVDPNNHTAFFPLSPYYDERIILVSSTGVDDKHQSIQNGNNATHSHYPMVDLCAPGYLTMRATPTDCDTNQWPYYGSSNGSSYAAPIVAGVAALMYSVNSCLTPAWCQDILKNTTDPILDAVNFPGGVGTGRVNAYKAVKEAQNAYSTTLDLYIKDRPEDFGDEQYPYHWQADRDESPDIWVRNQQDGIENQEHQEPEFSLSSPVYVYVRVRNKSCVAATGNEVVKLYWSKASGWTSWPSNWNGTWPSVGNVIGTINLDNLPPGRDTILEFTWNIINPYTYQNWATCLLARIENSSIDGITNYPNKLNDDVFYNNNIAMRNVTISDIFPGRVAPGWMGGVYFPHGRYMFIGNPMAEDASYDLSFVIPNDSLEPSILDDAEVKLIFDDEGWDLLHDKITQTQGLEILQEKEVLVTSDSVVIEDVYFPSDTRVPIYLGFSFLVGQMSVHDKFKYDVRQYLSEDTTLLGGVHYRIHRYDRDPFNAFAGEDKEINAGDSVLVSATSINEDAQYNWYDQSGELIHQGTDFYASPLTTHTYKLEVIADADGFKDYDEMQVWVRQNWIEDLSPNPASGQVTVSYQAAQATAAYITIMNQTATVSNNYNIDVNQSSTNIDLASYQTGYYTVVLVCDGIAVDAKSMIIQ